jgi:hypothetical protein
VELNIDKALSLFKLAADRGTHVCAGSWPSLLTALTHSTTAGLVLPLLQAT